MGLFSRFTEGLSRSRNAFRQEMNLLLNRGPKLDDEFWDGLEETLVMSDMGAYAADNIVTLLKLEATQEALPDAYAVLDLLEDRIADHFVTGGEEILGSEKSVVLFVGVNGSGRPPPRASSPRRRGRQASRSCWARLTRSAPLPSSSWKCGPSVPKCR